MGNSHGRRKIKRKRDLNLVEQDAREYITEKLPELEDEVDSEKVQEIKDEVDFISKYYNQFQSGHPCDMLEMRCLIESLREVVENFRFQSNKHASLRVIMDILKNIRTLHNRCMVEEENKSKEEYRCMVEEDNKSEEEYRCMVEEENKSKEEYRCMVEEENNSKDEY